MMSSNISDSSNQNQNNNNFTTPTSADQSTYKSFKSSVPIYSFDWSPNSPHFASLAIGSFITGQQNQSRILKNEVQFVNWTDPQATAFNQSCPKIEVDFPPTKVQYSPHRVLNHFILYYKLHITLIIIITSHSQYGNDELLGVAGDGLKIYRINEFNAPELIVKLLPAQISTSPTASNSASRRPSDANIIVSGGSGANGLGQNGTGTIMKNSPSPITSFDWNKVDPNLLVTSSYDTTCAVWNLNVIIHVNNAIQYNTLLTLPLL